MIYKLRTMDASTLNNLADVAEGLDNLMVKYAKETNSLEPLIQNIKSKRYTQTRIQRILLYVLFEITKEDMKLSKEIMPYVRVLGMDSTGEKILKDIEQNVLVTSVKKFYDGCNDEYKRLLDLDIKATNVYSLMCNKNCNADLDYTKGLIIKGENMEIIDYVGILKISKEERRIIENRENPTLLLESHSRGQNC